jgi:quinol monooxygenase YgiN
MHTLIVTVHVKPDRVEDFRGAILANARESVREPGIVRFDVLMQKDDPTRFVLYEVYRTPADHLKHRETAHYARFKADAESMMAGPRVGVTYDTVFPG